MIHNFRLFTNICIQYRFFTSIETRATFGTYYECDFFHCDFKLNDLKWVNTVVVSTFPTLNGTSAGMARGEMVLDGLLKGLEAKLQILEYRRGKTPCQTEVWTRDFPTLPSQFCDVWKHYQIRARTTEYGNEHVQVSYYWMRQKKRASFPCRVFIEYCEFFRREQTRKLCYCEFYGLSIDWLIFCVPRPGYAEEIHNTSGADSEAKWSFTESKQTCPTATNRVTKNNVS